MKYTIEGFGQAEALRLGLDVKDLVLLRWIVDFYNTGKMDLYMIDGKTYFWVDYHYLIVQLPILGITSSKVLSRRMKHLQECNVMDSICRPDSSGVRMYFRFQEDALLSLLTEKERQLEFSQGGRHSKVLPSPAVAGVEPESVGGRHSKVPGVGTQKYPGVDSSINDSSIKDRERRARKKFQKPTLAEVKIYFLEQKYKFDPEAFFDHYETNGWVQGNRGKPVVDWKACARTWAKRERQYGANVPAGGNGELKIDYKKYEALAEKMLGNMATDAMVKNVMRNMPQKAWWVVDKFIKKRYPNGDHGQFGRVEAELIRETKA